MWPCCTLTNPALSQAAGFGLGLGLRVHFPCVFFSYPVCLLRQLSLQSGFSICFFELQLSGEDPRFWSQTPWFKPQLCHSVAGQPSVNCLSSLCLSFIWLLHHPLYVDERRAPGLWGCSRSYSHLAAWVHNMGH